MWQVTYFDDNDRKWYLLSTAENIPLRFQTFEEAYSEMISLQKEGFKAYTEQAY